MEFEDATIDAGGYASEGGFLRVFSRAAARISEPGAKPEPAPKTRLMQRLAEAGGNRGLFALNMSILADDLYLSPASAGLPAQDRLELARLRARFGMVSVKTYRSLGIEVMRAQPPPAPRRPLLRAVSAVLSAWPGRTGTLLREARAYVSPAEIGETGFPDVVERWARSERHRAMLSLFLRRLARLNAELDRMPQAPSVWDLALKVTDGDRRDAAELLGAVVGQKKQPLRYVERRVLPRYADAAGADAAFADAARAYYLLGLLHERSLQRFGRSSLYPKGVALNSPKFWHFYAAAMTAGNLRAHGHAPRRVRLLGLALAAAYESYSLVFNLAVSPDSPAAALLPLLSDGLRDVNTQAAGGAWALGAPHARARRIGFLTGTFDPPHAGHLKLARLAADSGLDEVWLLPNPAPRHKPGAAPAQTRRQMTETLLAADFDLHTVDAGMLAAAGGDTGRLLALFKAARRAEGRVEFVHLAGMDSFLRLHALGLLEKEAAEYPLWIFARPGTPAPGDIPPAVAPRVLFFDTDFPHASSRIRTRQIRQGPESQRLLGPLSGSFGDFGPVALGSRLGSMDALI